MDGRLQLKKPASFAALKMGAIESEGYDGYERILAAAAEAVAGHLAGAIAAE